MATYSIEVQSDFLKKITRSTPIQALAEFVWNGLDADATSITVRFDYNALEAMSAIVFSDNGSAMTHGEAPEQFKRLGGSWKKLASKTRKDGRYLHGQDGRGRFKAFALGRVAIWHVTYEKESELWNYSVTMNLSDIGRVVISDESLVGGENRRGVTLTISDLHKDYRTFTSEAGLQQFTEVFALYLADYPSVSIRIDNNLIDPDKEIVSRHSASLGEIVDEDQTYGVSINIIEWRSITNRALYLCNERGFPFVEVNRRFHIGSFQFSAYLRSKFVSKFQLEGTLDVAEMNPLIVEKLDEAKETINDYFRNRAAEQARTVVEEWKEENIYPYVGDAKSHVDKVERQVFDIVAVNVSHYVPDFETTPAMSKAFHLRLLRQAIEKSPEELQLILSEVLKLPKRKQEELADLLREVSLSAIIGAAKIVADRLRFLVGLEAILFDTEYKKRLKERSQLHRIIAQNCWIFGEEFNFSVDDHSLTEVLRKHRKMLGNETAIDEPVKHISKERGIIDLMLSRAIRRHKANEIMHLVVELKAPRVKINQEEVGQVEGYAFSVMKDERFRGVNTSWVFWVVSDDYGDYAAGRMDSNGLIHSKDNNSIFVKTWAQILDENRARLQFFQERLEYQADKGSSLKHLQEHYSKFLVGVLDEEKPRNADSTMSGEDQPEAVG